MKTHLFHLPLLLASTLVVSAEIVPNSLFCDHAVLQRDTEVPIWGTADPGNRITVTIAGQSHETKVKADGRWLVNLSPVSAGGPYVLGISDETSSVEIDDILFGEVWLCSGQSNMAWLLRGRTEPMTNAHAEAAKATDPRFRYFKVGNRVAFSPEDSVEGNWTPCSPEVAFDFSGVSFFFGRYLLETLDVPIGIINSSWGGTAAESWTRVEALRPFDELADRLDEVDMLSEVDDLAAYMTQKTQDWYKDHDVGSRGKTWGVQNMDTSDWEVMSLPAVWEEAGHPDYDGIAWFRKSFDLPSTYEDRDLLLQLGVLDYYDTVWVNGVEVGSGAGNTHQRAYTIPASVLQPNGNVIAIRLLDSANVGGFIPTDAPFGLVAKDGGDALVDLAGDWHCQFTYELKEGENLPGNILRTPHTPSVLYNAMIAPLVPYAIRGVAWYQGESNANRARRYRDLFPAMIADWRQQWGIGEFPFLYVQIAPYKDQRPEIREAQLMTLERSPNTAMIVTTDVGNPDDIHPLNKGPVGERLGLAARALAYGEAIEYSGPIYSGWEVQGAQAIISFDHIEGGLVVPGGTLLGFTMAGADGVFHPAEATVEGDQVIVTSSEVTAPQAVRYGWSNTPNVNLFNGKGLPASPFRTDVD